MRSICLVFLAAMTLTVDARFREVEISHLGAENFEFSGRLMLIKGEVHHYELPDVGVLAWLPLQTCGATYEAIVVEDLTQNFQPGERVKFSAPEEKELGSEWFVSLYSGTGRLMNDVVHKWTDPVAQQRKAQCESELVNLRSLWITSGEIYREWIPFDQRIDFDEYQGIWVHRQPELRLPEGAPIAVNQAGELPRDFELEVFQEEKIYLGKEIYVPWEFIVNEITDADANKRFNTDADKAGAG